MNKSTYSSEEILDILNETPRWLLRYGAYVFLFIIILFLTGAWIIRYPEVLKGQAMVSNSVPPIKVVSAAEGRISKILVADETFVKKGTILAEMESATQYAHLPILRALLAQTRTFLSNPERQVLQMPADTITWGDLQVDMDQLNQEYDKYKMLQQDAFQRNQVNNMQSQLVELRALSQVIERQQNIETKTLANTKEGLTRDEKLYAESLFSRAELQKTENTYLQKSAALEELQKQVILNKLKQSEIQKSIRDFEQVHLEKSRTCLANMELCLRNLENKLNHWQQHYLLTAPADGKVAYLKQLTENQYVNHADTLFALLPAQEQYIAMVDIPVHGMGKAQVGQKVILKMEDYPYQEFGTLEGRIVDLSPALKSRTYRVVVDLPKGLKSSYKREFYCQSELAGTAEIITEDLRLLERVFYGFRKLMI